MKKIILLICFLCSLGSVFGNNPVTDTVLIGHLAGPGLGYSIEHQINILPYLNPANKYRHGNPSTQIEAGGRISDMNKPLIIQEGDGDKVVFVDVHTFYNKDNYSFWGGAAYENGVKQNIRYNETSDFALLYPYVMGDTIGGDLNYESYRFAGGFAKDYGEWRLGAEADFNAVQAYRGVDPRPRNISTTLNASLGANINVSENYSLGLSLHGKKYKQTNELSFYSELGKPNVYHYTGLDTDYARFRGNNESTFYNGYLFGTTVSVLPLHRIGSLAATLHYSRFSFEKIIKTLNRLPMAKANDHNIQAEVAYNGVYDWGRWAVKADALWASRRGTENIFGDPVNNNYTQIAANDLYEHTIKRANLSFFWNGGWGVLPYSISPSVGYSDLEMKYINPAKHLGYEHLTAALSVLSEKKYGQYLFSLSMKLEQAWGLDSEIDLGSVEYNNYMQPVLIHNYTVASGNSTRLYLSPQVSYLLKDYTQIYLRGEWQRAWHPEGIHANYGQVAIGYRF